MGYIFQVDASSFGKVADKLKSSGVIVENACEKMILRAALMAEAKAKEKAPIDKGILRGSITHRVEHQGNTIIGRVGTNLDYAVHQEYGTGLYGRRKDYIYPRRSKVLRFKVRGGGIVFARRVRGTQGKFFIKKGLQEVKDRIEEIKSFGIKLLREGLI